MVIFHVPILFYEKWITMPYSKKEQAVNQHVLYCKLSTYSLERICDKVGIRLKVSMPYTAGSVRT